MKNRLSSLLIPILISCIFNFTFICYAQDSSESNLSGEEDFKKLKDSYLENNRYSEFVDYLKEKKDTNPAWVSYYIALARHQQLQYLEESQEWQEYFDKGEEYRQELIKEVLNAINLTQEKDPLFVYAKSLLWEFHRDMQVEEEKDYLLGLLSTVRKYSDAGDIDISVIKYVADKLNNYGERTNSLKIYNIYLGKLVSSLKEDRDSKLISLAKQLSYRDGQICNPFFAEEVFKKLKEISPDLTLDEETQYLRAYNLEKIKQYSGSYPQYQVLVENYPRSAYCSEALFKMGLMCAYILGDIPTAVDYLNELIERFPLSPNIIAAFYQLGLISQYQGDISKAQEYYKRLLDNSAKLSCCEDYIRNVQDRLKEIEEKQPLEFNLKSFMDFSMKEAKGIAWSNNVDINVQAFRLVPQQVVRVSSVALPEESGCFQINLEYLWAGDLGNAHPGNNDDSFSTHYTSPTTKVIMLVVITPTGILGHSLVFLDVNY